jgi:hypothetical protein
MKEIIEMEVDVNKLENYQRKINITEMTNLHVFTSAAHKQN